MDVLTLIFLNLRNVGIGLLLFVLAYIANMLFASWRNVKMLGQKFDGHRLLDSLLKGGSGGKLHLTDDNLVNLQMLYNMADKAGK